MKFIFWPRNDLNAFIQCYIILGYSSPTFLLCQWFSVFHFNRYKFPSFILSLPDQMLNATPQDKNHSSMFWIFISWSVCTHTHTHHRNRFILIEKGMKVNKLDSKWCIARFRCVCMCVCDYWLWWFSLNDKLMLVHKFKHRC